MSDAPAYPLGARLDDLAYLPLPSDDDLLSSWLGWVEREGLRLYPHQEEAALELLSDKHLIVETPTGSGKTLIATALAFFAVARGRRVWMTFPVKALVSEKFFELCRLFGPDRVGMMTGDASVNRDAPIVCCTAEVLANVALREGDEAPVDAVVMDEFHYYGDRDRGVAWQVPLLCLRRAQLLLMSATLGDVAFFERALAQTTERAVATLPKVPRPVPLEYRYSDHPLHEAVQRLVAAGGAPLYLVNFTQRGAAEEAQNLTSVELCTKDEKRAITAALVGEAWPTPFGKQLKRFLQHGVGIHHAGMLPRYRLLIEKLAQAGLLKVISGTDTLGVGVNIPLKTVLLTQLCKYDGQKTALLTAREFHQITGRAGRRGFHDHGFVVCQAPAHVIENLRLEAKAGDDPVKKRRIVRKKPPERGYVHWDKAAFERLVAATPEALPSRFAVTHAMVLAVVTRPEGGCAALKRLLRDNHERPGDKRAHKRRALALFRSLVEAGVLELVPRSVDPRGLRLARDLPADFAMNNALALYLVDTLPRLDRALPTHALDVLTLVEAVADDPDVVLARQLDKLKGERVAELKAAGVEYDERMAELEKLEWPKPNAEFLYLTFDAFRAENPWLEGNVRPKSVARDLVERCMSFTEYVREYGLERSEGALLRYLTEVYKLLAHGLPEGDRTPDVLDLVATLESVVRGTDASLLEEWERLRDPEVARAARRGIAVPAAPQADLGADRKKLSLLARNELFRLVRALSRRDWEGAAEAVEGSREPWSPARFSDAMKPYFAEHESLRADAAARDPSLVTFTVPDDGADWRAVQVLVDDEGATTFALEADVELDASRRLGRAVLAVRRIG